MENLSAQKSERNKMWEIHKNSQSQKKAFTRHTYGIRTHTCTQTHGCLISSPRVVHIFAFNFIFENFDFVHNHSTTKICIELNLERGKVNGATRILITQRMAYACSTRSTQYAVCRQVHVVYHIIVWTVNITIAAICFIQFWAFCHSVTVRWIRASSQKSTQIKNLQTSFVIRVHV